LVHAPDFLHLPLHQPVREGLLSGIPVRG
jgi:hypothetical protein